MSKPITENIIEQSVIEVLQSQGWEYANGKEIISKIKHISTLTQLWYTLLPKLMSGEVKLEI